MTLEPCCHHGKTPPCTDAVLDGGVGRVVVAMADPFPRVAGGGLASSAQAGIEVEVGLLEDEARRLNAPYLKRLGDRPAVRHGQVGDDARRQDRHGLGRQPMDLRPAVARAASTSSGAGWTRSSSGSAPRWPTIPG